MCLIKISNLLDDKPGWSLSKLVEHDLVNRRSRYLPDLSEVSLIGLKRPFLFALSNSPFLAMISRIAMLVDNSICLI